MRVATRTAGALVAAGVMLQGASAPLATAGVTALRAPNAAAPASFALTSVGNAVQAVANVASGTPSAGVVQNENHTVTGTAIDPAGQTALISTGGNSLVTVHGLRSTAPKTGAPLSLAQFVSEGGPDFGVFADGSAITGTAGLAAVDAQGVVQLQKRNGAWRVDTRVHSAGTNEAGHRHAAGFIRTGRPVGVSSAISYGGVAVSQVPLPDGRYVGLAIDRLDRTLAVIVGVGTAHPSVTAVLKNDAFAQLTHNENAATDPGKGTGGLAFSFATATRAAIAGPSGVAILNLADPHRPRLQSVTTAPGSPDEVSALAVSADGKTLALNSLGSIDLYRGLLGAADAPLTQTATFTPAGSMYPSESLGFTATGRLIAQHLAYDPGTSTQFEQLSSYRLGIDDTNPPAGSTSLAGPPASNNSMSVYPAGTIPSIQVKRSPTVLRAHGKCKIILSVRHPIGRYVFRVVQGRLPAGLHLHGRVISGRPKHRETRHLRLRALNQYGGAAFTTYTLKVRPRR